MIQPLSRKLRWRHSLADVRYAAHFGPHAGHRATSETGQKRHGCMSASRLLHPDNKTLISGSGFGPLPEVASLIRSPRQR